MTTTFSGSEVLRGGRDRGQIGDEVTRMRYVMLMAALLSNAALADEGSKKMVATTEQGTYDAINSNPKLQRGILSALLLAADGLELASRAVVAHEKRMARETVYVRPEALREARRLLEVAESWRRMGREQLKSRGMKPIPKGKQLQAMAPLAGCIVATETDDRPPGCDDVDTAAAVKWAIAEESDE